MLYEVITVDAYSTWKLFIKQNIDSGKIRATLYDKVITPLFAIAMVLILFFKLPFHARMINFSVYVIVAVGVSLITWGTLFGFRITSYNVCYTKLLRLMHSLLYMPSPGVGKLLYYVLCFSSKRWLGSCTKRR